MSDRENLLEDLTSDGPAPADTIDSQVDDNTPDPVDTEVDTPAAEDDKPAGEPLKETHALLDALTEGGKPAEEEKPGEEAPKDEAKPAEQKTLDEQEAEALEGVKSERGQERIKAVFAERRALETEKQQLQSDINEFREMVQSTGMKPEEFAQTLEFGRLVNSGNEADLRVALQMVDQQRELICKQLGIEAPGVDPLSDFPDLKRAVENMEITKDHALKLARYEREKQQVTAQQQAQQTAQRSQQEYLQQIDSITKTAESYFATRQHEADYPAKMAQIAAKFRDPAFMQEFVSTYEPKQWFGVMKMMYDAIAIPQQRAVPRDQPLRGRAANTGQRVSNANESSVDRLSRAIDSLGI